MVQCLRNAVIIIFTIAVQKVFCAQIETQQFEDKNKQSMLVAKSVFDGLLSSLPGEYSGDSNDGLAYRAQEYIASCLVSLSNGPEVHGGMPCVETFTTPSKVDGLESINDHKNSHENTRPFKCKVVGCTNPGFNDRSNLAKHMKYKHGGEKKYKCSLCRAAFLIKADLTRHTTRHSTIKAIKCQVVGCRSTFKRRDNMMRHVRQVHRVQLFLERRFKN